jgi:hypothetical protein
MDRNIIIVQQLEQVFQPYRSIFRDEGEIQEAAPITVFLRKKRKALNT